LTDARVYKGYYNEFSFPGVIRSAITAVMPRVMQERPELIRKIQDHFDRASSEETLLMAEEDRGSKG